LAPTKPSGLQVNYCHSDKGGYSYGLTLPSDPPLFSPEWWDLFTWWAGECNRRGIAVSLSDYTLGMVGQGYWMDEILREDPSMTGRILEHTVETITGNTEFTSTVPENTISIVAYGVENDSIIPDTGVDLQKNLSGRILRWTAPAGSWRVVTVYFKINPNSMDPMNLKTGPMIIEKFFQRFENALPGQSGKGLNFFFSDELWFGVGGNLWSDRVAEEFRKRKGYNLVPRLAAIFLDIGPMTPKIRLDYYDVLVQLQEEAYFRPVYEWHESRKMIYGCDHGGRGLAVTEFGDYFRTMRWMSGPGCDQPFLRDEVIKNKVATSSKVRVGIEQVGIQAYGACRCVKLNQVGSI